MRKRVRTEREQLRVPTRHEKVSVERVSVEEVVTEKRPVVKEEIRVRKAVVEEEVIEEDVRKEEVDVENSTTRGGSREAILDDAEARHHNR